MKKLVLCIIIYSSNAGLGFGQNNQWLLQQRLPGWAEKKLSSPDFQNSYLLSEFINPFYLEGDFNGDSKLDIAVAIENKVDHKKGVIILHNATNERYIFGAGKEFGNGGDNFEWMNVWKLQRSSTVHQLVYKTNGDIDDSIPLQLKNTSIIVTASERGGVIYWDEKNYRWAQLSE